MRKGTLRGRVGSLNPVKVTATTEVMEGLFGHEKEIVVDGVDVRSDVPNEPWEEQVFQGASNRAKKALGEADLGVGIEAGLFKVHGEIMDIQYCVVIDQEGKTTFGQGPAFRYPPKVLDEVAKGRTVGEIMSELSKIENVGERGGAINYLTKGYLDRTALTKIGVLMAMVPRIRENLY